MGTVLRNDSNDQPLSSTPDAKTAVQFLQDLDSGGRHNLVRMCPTESHPPIGKTFEPGDWPGVEEWVAEFNGHENLYWSVNEPRAGAPNAKLGKADIGALRCIGVDVDPRPDRDLDQERAAILHRLRALSGAAPPTFIVDSGGGYQAVWTLADKMPVEAEGRHWAEDQARGFAAVFGGDAVGNIDRVFRLPGTINIPNAKKRSRGRVERLAVVVEKRHAAYQPVELSALAAPRAAGSTTEPSDAEIAACMAGLDLAGAPVTIGDLPADLAERFRAACRNNPGLDRAWRREDVRGDDSQSGRCWHLADQLHRAAVFTAQDFCDLLHVWDEIDQERLTARDIARAWVRSDPRPADWFDILADEDDPFATPLATVSPAGTEPLAWLDPTRWQGLEIPRREWEVAGWIPRGEVTLLYGDGGIGKTLLAQQYATAAAAGLHWVGLPTRRARVMCFFCEDDEAELMRRQRDINQSLGIEYSALSDLRMLSRKHMDNYFVLWDRNTGAMKRQTVWNQLRADAIDFGADVLVIDTIADVYSGNEIDRAQVTAFIKSCLGRLANEIGGSVIALGHPSMSGKASGSGTSGSTAWSNAARSRLFLRYPQSKTDGPVRELEGMKSNYGPKGNLLRLRWARGAFELIGANQTPLAAEANDISRPAGPEPQSLDALLDARVLQAITGLPGARLTMTPNSPYFAPKVLKTNAPDLFADFGKQEIGEAVRRLEAKRQIRRVSDLGQDGAGRPTPGYVIEQSPAARAPAGGVFD